MTLEDPGCDTIRTPAAQVDLDLTDIASSKPGPQYTECEPHAKLGP